MQYSSEQRDHITIMTCSGAFDLDAFRVVIRELWAAGQFQNPYTLVDVRACTNAMEPDDFKAVREFLRGSMKRRAYGRIAIVGNESDKTFIQGYCKALEDAPFEITNFTLRSEALEWLEAMI